MPRKGQKIPVPSGFRELAPGSSTAELAKAYGRSADTVRRWRRECGIPPPERTRPARGDYKGMDTPEQIRYCLNCPVKKGCYGLKCPLLPPSGRVTGKDRKR